MAISRRMALTAGAMAGLSVLMPDRILDAGGLASAPVLPPSDDPLAQLSRSSFLRQLDTSFLVQRKGRRPVLTRLVEVADNPTAEQTGTRGNEECFAALFTGPVSAPLQQATYTVRHLELGTFQLFLVPVGRPGKAISYEAVFNRVIEP